MGKSEISTASLGYKIKISDLVEQLDSNNINIILIFLQKGFIEDENDGFNTSYMDVVDFCYSYFKTSIKKKDEEEIQKFKQILISELKDSGNVIELKNGGCSIDKSTTLYDLDLLIPAKNILETTRWGYDRYGINGTSIPLKDLKDVLESINNFNSGYPEYNIKNLEMVFILKQESG